MRIVETDNFDGDYPDERFLLGRLNEEAAEEIADIINKHCGGPYARRYWKVVEDDYTLRPGFEP